MKLPAYLIRSKGKTALVTGQISKSKLLEQRAAGYRRALEEAGEEFDETLIFQGDITFEYGQAAAAQILERGDVSQILATADILARGVINLPAEQRKEHSGGVFGDGI